ncbi:23355_t:CDS:2 [Entrophospora sp. SA101]|nr:11771_t:CDS:2 [Entrophospora sp. SA101]CAJ0747731.1 23501_t:CDS:2 [Entrophospora sp. SA101]CAJ0758067.1 23355_t:CDS:2 [Entrophospora sp. SA101]CAJ0902759.1 10172_t:CDS:2 [Entrophospora sp. SA101]
MPVCVHEGCKKTYTEEENNDNACLYHPKPPIFHEGLKGWQCCDRRVTSFDEFLIIPGCTKGQHTDQIQQPSPSSTDLSKNDLIDNNNKEPMRAEGEGEGVEVYSGPKIPFVQSKEVNAKITNATIPSSEKTKPQQMIVEEPEDDDPNIPVTVGTVCKRSGCGKKYIDEKTSRGEGPEAECIYHPGTATFHEGSKGWSCCTRKVLEFEEFLKIKGCKKGKHLFVGNIDKQKSTINFQSQELIVDLRFSDSKIFKEIYPLYEKIDPEKSKFEYLSTKVEIKLKKANGISWQTLRSDENSCGAVTTFGVQGGNATVGGKEYTIAEDSPLYSGKQK